MESARGERWQVSQRGGSFPRWSGDGLRLFYRTRDSLLVADAASGPDFLIRARRALYSIDGFARSAGYAVLPGDGGFLMARQHAGRRGGRQLVVLERWNAALDGDARSR
jgi:hypothetical protein